MSKCIKCDRCNKITKADSSGDKRYEINVYGFDGYSAFHLCEGCLRSFYSDFLGWKWNDDESQYVPQAESENKGMYIACKKCKYNHNGECDFYYMGSGNEIDMPCCREKELIKKATDNFLQAYVGAESEE